MRALRASIAVASIAGIGWPVTSYALDIQARVSAATIYSDNITLAPKGEEDGDFALRADPSVVITSTGARYDFALDYALEAYYFKDQDDSTSVFHQGKSTLDIALIPEHLNLISLAMIDQVIKDPSGTVSFGNLPVTGNRTEATRLEIMPRWRQDILGSEFVVSYSLGRYDYDDRDLQDMEYRFIDAQLSSPDVDHGLGWGARYEHQTHTYDLPPDLKRQLAEVSLSWSLGGGWTPFGAFGRESDVLDRTDASMTETLWRAGLRRRAASSFIEVFGGDRSFGSWYGALIELREKSDPRNLVRLSYDETPTVDEGFDAIRTFGDLTGLGQPGDPAVPAIIDPTLPPGIVGPGARQIYTRKMARLLVSRSINRSDISFVLFHEKDEHIVSLDQPDISQDNEETGAAINVLYRLGSRTHLNGQTMYSRRKFNTSGPDGSNDDLLHIRLGARYQLGQRTDVNFWVAHAQQDGSVSNDHKENQVGISIGRTF